jgi:hypothetical protein
MLSVAALIFLLRFQLFITEFATIAQMESATAILDFCGFVIIFGIGFDQKSESADEQNYIFTNERQMMTKN